MHTQTYICCCFNSNVQYSFMVRFFLKSKLDILSTESEVNICIGKTWTLDHMEI